MAPVEAGSKVSTWTLRRSTSTALQHKMGKMDGRDDDDDFLYGENTPEAGTGAYSWPAV